MKYRKLIKNERAKIWIYGYLQIIFPEACDKSC
jgi:hypothetical protein